MVVLAEFWENWYIIGENEKSSSEEFKFVYYNGKTRQNTYEGAFVYSRTPELSSASLARIYQIAQDAGMDPDKFCKIQNQCFLEDEPTTTMIENEASDKTFWRGLLASTRVSELLGVEPVAARDTIRTTMVPTAPPETAKSSRSWWSEAGDYFENPHRHFQAMEKTRVTMEWPEEVRLQQQQSRR